MRCVKLDNVFLVCAYDTREKSKTTFNWKIHNVLQTVSEVI